MSLRSERILRAMQSAKLSYGALHEITGIPKSALQRYATGETEKIPIDRIELIAKATGVSAAYLMGWDEDAATHDDILSKDESELLSRYRNLPENRKKAVLELLKDD